MATPTGRATDPRYLLFVGASVLLGVVAVSAGDLGAQEPPPCDPVLLDLAFGVQGYAPRGDRCEGVYSVQVRGTPLYPVSLTAGFADYAPGSLRGLRVRWPAQVPATGGGGSTVHLQALGLDPRLGYQMDVAVPLAASEYEWPTHILAAQGIGHDELGVLAVTTTEAAGEPRQVHLPVVVTQPDGEPPEGPLRLVAYPGSSFDTLTVTVLRLLAHGEAEVRARDVAHPWGFWPADRPIPIDLEDYGVTTPGLYVVRISASTFSGRPAGFELWIYRPSPDPAPG